ncbi:hypothetical protein OPV22_001466 [Ensete ventricosum]|uniref:Uncharacterized protein n=1 Tax=Ensete ventricosum TaxID=4639 RepID=A0AAV8RQ84_ENSVE|nr:hypothetical protein OPV22_001466 [Ensete ventricosum]
MEGHVGRIEYMKLQIKKKSLMYIKGYSKLSKIEKIVWSCIMDYPCVHFLSLWQSTCIHTLVLFTEATTPFVNLRWYLDLSGQIVQILYDGWLQGSFCSSISSHTCIFIMTR